MAASAVAQPSLVQGNPQPVELRKTAAEYWTDYVNAGMVPLFQATGTYTPEQQAAHLKFIADNVINKGVFGPLPSEPHPQYTMPYIGAPMEFSLNLTASGKAKGRIGLEVVGPHDRTTGPDPFAEQLSRTTLARIAKEIGADMRWSESLMDSMWLTPEETEAVRNSIPDFVPSTMLAFDFDGNSKSMKTYFPSLRKAMATGKTSTELILGALRKFQPLGDLLAPNIDILDEYLATCTNGCIPVLVAMDCVDPKDARIKIYMNIRSNSWNNVVDVMTLGGRLNDEHTLKGIEILKGLYHLLRDEPEGHDDDWSKTEHITGIPFSGLQFSVELTASKAIPEVKLYVPMFQYAETTTKALENFETVLKKLDHEWGHTERYTSTMKQIFGEKRHCGMGFATFSYSKKKGAYMTTYYMLPTEVAEPTFKASNFVYI